MIIKLKKNIILIDEFKFKCSIGKWNSKNKLKEIKLHQKELFH